MTNPETPTAKAPAPATLPDAVMEVVRATQSKKAANVLVLDLRGTGAFTDFFIICTGRHGRQVKAIADAVEASVKRTGPRPRVEGYEHARWVLLDCFDLVVHIFTPETRAFYDLERLWGDASRVEVPELEHEGPAPS